jgi:Sperm-tail PG-rich repeat
MVDEPGPGHYSPYADPFKPASMNPSLAKEARYPAPPATTPGPGDYNTHLPIFTSNTPSAPQASFPRTGRSRATESETPGPGTYALPTPTEEGLDKNKGVSFPRDVKRTPDNGTPGPGHYTLKSMIADVPKYLLPQQHTN